MKRAALIGMGEIFKIHLAVLRSMESADAAANVKIAAVCDIDPAKAELCPGVPFYTDYKEMFARERLDCVHICLPHYLHEPVARDAVEAGLDVFCEKPLAITAAQAGAFAALEREHPERRIGVCLQNRYNPSSQALMRIIGSGGDGRVVGLRGSVPWARPLAYYEQAPWRGTMREAGGGVMLNQSVHTLDLLHVFGGEVARIKGSIAQLLDYGIEVEDTASARIEFKGGAVGQFFATVACERNMGVEIEVSLEKATYVIRDNRLLRRDGEGYETVVEDERLPGSKFYYGASHHALIGRFYRCLEQGGRDYPNVADAAVSIRMIDAIRRSSETGRAVDMAEYA